jgi:DGQHR domain-containing protein
MQLNVMETVQNGKKLYICIMKAKDLVQNERVKIDYYDAKRNEGYQRKPSMSRARDFARYIKNAAGISPNSILINIRGALGNFKPLAPQSGILTIPDTTELWIVDGQHRFEGLRDLTEQDPSFGEFPCFVILMNENTEYEEAKQFMIINKTQKGVRSDLAERFIATMMKKEGTKGIYSMPKATIRDIEWRPRATDIVDILNKEISDDPNNDFFENPWHRRIQLPNEPKALSTISQSSFENSLKILIESPTFSEYGNRDLSIILIRYWKAILEICPNAKIQPEKYFLQRLTGTAVLNRILPRVLALTKLKSQRITKDAIKQVLEKMPDVMNEIFWSPDGEAGIIGTSQKALAILTSRVLDSLDKGNADNADKLKEMSKPYEL